MSESANNELTAEARAAWLAYLEMGESKKTYFAYLQSLDEKYDRNQSPSIAENLKLEELLKSHDEKVKTFNTAMSAVLDADAREALLKKLTGDANKTGAH